MRGELTFGQAELRAKAPARAMATELHYIFTRPSPSRSTVLPRSSSQLRTLASAVQRDSLARLGVHLVSCRRHNAATIKDAMSTRSCSMSSQALR